MCDFYPIVLSPAFLKGSSGRAGILTGGNDERRMSWWMLINHEVYLGKGGNKGKRLLMDRRKWKGQSTRRPEKVKELAF